MSTQAIFGLQFALSIIAWSVVARVLLLPWLKKKPPNEALIWLMVPHAFRHVGMVFLVPGVVAEPLPGVFAVPAAYGDLLAGVLALVAIIGVRSRWPGAFALVWLFNVVGTLDLANALRQPDPIPAFGAAWYIPTFLVPLLLVTHLLIFIKLMAKRAPEVASPTAT